MKKTGLYIHVPFCIQKCAYCDFYSQTDLQSADRFVSSICTHIRLLQNSMKDRLFDTVYMGGGTPSLLSCSQMKQLQDAFRSCFHFADSCEFTIEANPATLDEKKLEAYRQIGINRLSIGLQSAYDGELKKLSRVHNYADFLESYQLARKAGFENISVDLMYGIPDQSVESLLSGLETVCQLKPQHISLYGLKIEKNTFFGRMESQLHLPDEDSQCEMYIKSIDLLKQYGYNQYEISNFSQNGYECQHNIRYWEGKEYLGLGPAAHSYLDGTRYSYSRNLTEYIERIEQKVLPIPNEMNVLTPKDIKNEHIICGLRLTKGILADSLLLQKAKPYIKAEFMKYREGVLSFTAKGFLVSNTILSDLME